MISINLTLQNPFSLRWKCIAYSAFQLSEHKVLELQFDRTNDIIGFCLRLRLRTDHAGVFVSLALLGYDAALHFYDTRHWDRENNV